MKDKFNGFKKGQLVIKQKKEEPINSWIETEINIFNEELENIKNTLLNKRR